MIDQHTDFKILVQTAQVQGLSAISALPQITRSIIASADQAQRQLTHEELQTICGSSGVACTVPNGLLSRADQLVDEARGHLLQTEPALVQPGGALYPQERAEACWRDCWNFLRVIIYAVACNHSTFTSPGGMEALRELYKRMKVPMHGMNIALDELKRQALEGILQASDRQLISDCFEHLRAELNKSAVKS